MSGAVARLARRRVLLALRRGALYEGALQLVVDGATASMLRRMERDALIERTGDGYTWRLTERGRRAAV